MANTRPQCFVRGIYFDCDYGCYLQFSDGAIWRYQPVEMNDFLVLASAACKGCLFNATWRPRLAAQRVPSFPTTSNGEVESATFETGQPVVSSKTLPNIAQECLFYEEGRNPTCPVDPTAPDNCENCDAFVALPFNFGNVES